MTNSECISALQRAIQEAGSQTELIKRMNEAAPTRKKPFRQQHIWNWLHRDKTVPAEAVLPIEAATKGKVTRHELRVDLYPEEESMT